MSLVAHQPGFALNHMTVPGMAWRDLVLMAARLGCCGIELRGDLPTPMFGDDLPEAVGGFCADHGIRILALAEVPRFNDGTPEVLAQTRQLARNAVRAGAQSIILIPRLGGDAVSFDQLCMALDAIGTVLAEERVRALIEPLGFASSSLRSFDMARRAIEATHGPARFGIVHDTFHHHLAGGGAVSADYVEIIHISGVRGTQPRDSLTDADRVLVDAEDRLGNVEQLGELKRLGCVAPLSVEAFAPEIHTMAAPEAALETTYAFISANLDTPIVPVPRDARTTLNGVPV